MRTRMNGRGLHPEVRDSTFRFWPFDNVEISTSREMIGGSLHLQQIGVSPRPTILQSPIGTRSRSFDGTSALATGDASADSPTMQGEWTVTQWVRLRIPNPAGGWAWALSGDLTLETQPTNNQASMFINSSRTISVLWENGAGVDQGFNFSTFALVPGRWTCVTLRKRFDNPDYVVDLIVNGEIIETSIAIPNADGGTDSGVAWSVAGQVATGFAAGNVEIDVASLSVDSTALPIDDIEDDFRRGYALEQATWVDMRVEVEDANGDFRDLCDLEGVDMVDQMQVTERVDDQVKTFSLNLAREQSAISVALLRTDSKLNLTDVGNPLSFGPLLAQTRRIRLFAARVPLGVYAEGLDFSEQIDGIIDTLDWGSGDQLVATGRDFEGARLVDTFIEEVVANPSIILNVPEPEQPSYGLTGGEALQTVQQKILDDNDNDAGNNSVPTLSARPGSYDPITLVVDGTPTWLLKPYSQEEAPVLSAIRNLSGMIGWETKPRHNEGLFPSDDGFDITLYEPQRARVDSDLLLTEREILDVVNLRVDIKKIRTVVRIGYLSSEATAPVLPPLPAGITGRNEWFGLTGEGSRLNAFVELTDTAALAEYDRRFMMIGERSSSQIDTLTEALRMAQAILSDLSEPDAEKGVTTPLLLEMEVGDSIRFEAIRELFTAAQKLAIVETTHSFGARAQSTFQLRGKPAVGFKRWLRLETKPGQGRPAVSDPRRALADSQAGPLSRVVRAVVDTTSYLNGGKYLAILNQDFQFFSAGVQNPPDSWRLEIGTWNTDVQEDSTVTLTGGHSVRFNNVNGILVSKRVPIQGDTNQPFSFELAWQTDAAGIFPNLLVRWLDAAGVNLGTTALTPGGASTPANPNFPPVDPTLANVWNISRVDGIHVPFAAARFMEIELNTAGGNVYIDRVTGYRTSRATRAAKDTTQGIGGWGTTTGSTPYNQALTVLGAIPAFAQVYDRGKQWVEDRTSPTPNNGNHFLTREPGTYEVRALLVPFASAPGVINYEWQLVLNGTYNAGGARATGTVVASLDVTKTFVAGGGGGVAGADVFEAEIDLSEYNGTPGNGADRLSLDLVVKTVGPQMLLNTGISTVPTFLSVKQRGLD